MAAGVGVGMFKDFNVIHKFIQIEEEIIPDMENHSQYEPIKEVFENSYKALLGIYDELAKL